MSFMYDSLPYASLASKAQYIFYSGIGVIQRAIINKGLEDKNLSLTSDYLQYYRQFFDVHYNTFGKIDSYH